MYSLTTRLNSIFFFGVSMLAVLAAFNIITGYFSNHQPTLNKFKIYDEYSMYTHYKSNVQHSKGFFDIDIDFTPIMNWNNLVVFMWISAEYTTGKSGQTTKVTIYDKILLRNQTDSYHVVLENQLFEYPIIDNYQGLKGKEVKIELNWEHMPVVGPILKFSKPLARITLPTYTRIPNEQHIRTEYHYYEILGFNYFEEDRE